MRGQFFIVESRSHHLGDGDGRLEALLDRPPDPEWAAAFAAAADERLVLSRDLIVATVGATSTVEDVVDRVNALVALGGSRVTA